MQNAKLLLPKKMKIVILSHIQKGKKKTVILTTHLYSNILFISVFVIYFYSNTSIIFIKKNTKLLLKKKKKPLPHVKTNHSYSEIFMVFFFYSLKHSKNFVI